MSQQPRRRVVIMGAAGRDFHNFNVVYRDDPRAQVVAFTAAQIPGIGGRRYPASLAGPHHPHGIPIHDEAELETLCRLERVDEVVFAYSDVAHEDVMHAASRALACGADFTLLGPARTMLRARRPVIAVSAVRTGCGKSPLCRWLSRRLQARRLRAAVIRHPMPYGELERQAAQRFASRADLDAAGCTLEEREEYEPHLALGSVVFAGVDTARLLELAEKDADLILWDGGNNDFPFLRPDLHLVLVDALRPAHVTSHHPGEANLRLADAVVVTKVDAAADADVLTVERAVRALRPDVPLLRGASPVHLDEPEAVRGRRVLVVEDAPTLTHGGMRYGAGYVAAIRAQAGTLIDPREFAAPPLAALYARHPHIGPVLPTLGYGREQLDALRETIRRARPELVVAATPIDLAARLELDVPVVRVRYEFAEAGEPRLGRLVDDFLDRAGPGA